MEQSEQSKNERAGQLMGKRKPGLTLDFPSELGYACPICGWETLDGWVLLEWSEYHGFLWCPKCNIDIPSCLCVKRQSHYPGDGTEYSPRERIEKATEIFLQCVEDALRRRNGADPTEERAPRIIQEQNEMVREKSDSPKE
jgi:hypothetical protein